MDKKIIDYKTLTAENTVKLDNEVALYLTKSWQPYGLQIRGARGLAAGQVMVKYEDTKMDSSNPSLFSEKIDGFKGSVL